MTADESPGALRDRLFGRSGVLAMAAGALVLLLIVGNSARLALLNHERLGRVVQEQVIQRHIEGIRASIADAETGQRGFLLTGRDSYLEPYTRAVARLPSQMTALREELKQDPNDTAALGELQAALDAKLAELAQTVAMFRSGDAAGARALVLTDRGQQEMNFTLQALNALATEQVTELRRQIDEANSGSLFLVVADGVGVVAVLILAGFAALGISRSAAVLRMAQRDLTLANARLAGLNDSLEATVATRTADLQEANDEIQRFAYIVSHDLRAPLVNIMGFTGELEVATQALRRFTEGLPEGLPPDVRNAADEDLPEAIHFIRASTSKMDRLIGAILRLSREGQRGLAPEHLDMRLVLGGIVDSVRHQAVAGDIDIVIESLPDLFADRLTIEQIFSNILDNALKYRMPGRPGRIVVRGRKDGNLARYEVADNGRGIADRDRQRIFDLFRRAGDQTVPGEGIGLAHVRAQVRRLGGRIDCESTPGAGSVFRVQLPLKVDRTELVQ